MIRYILTLLLLVIAGSVLFAQTDTVATIDTGIVVNQALPVAKKSIVEVDTPPAHSPKKAMIYSALLPGAGQIYNKKYWKAPVVWAGFAVFGYFINQNNREYKRFRKAYNYSVDTFASTVSEFPNADPALLANERDVYRKWRDLSIILTVGWYALNIIDANVDAHLFEFNVNDVATLRWEPTFNMAFQQPNTPFSGGVRLSLGF